MPVNLRVKLPSDGRAPQHYAKLNRQRLKARLRHRQIWIGVSGEAG
jgi:hypothetical protein